MTKSLKQIVPLALALFVLFGYQFIGAQWTDAPSNPPSNNALPPINVGVDSSSVQVMNGGLAMDNLAVTGISYSATEMRSPRYCDENGQNCFASADVGVGGTGTGTITIGGQCFEPAYAVACSWNWSGDGNDTATYFAPFSADPTTYCTEAVNRTYQNHTMVLAQCDIGEYTWQPSSWSACNAPEPPACGVTYGTHTRTVQCADSNGNTVDDSLCTNAKPATSGSCARAGADDGTCWMNQGP